MTTPGRAQEVRCLLCGHRFPKRQMRQMLTSADWVCKNYAECLDRQKEKKDG